MSGATLITCGSWEDRFIEGMKKQMADNSVARTIGFFYKEYDELSAPNREKADVEARRRGLEIDWKSVSFDDPAQMWGLAMDTASNYVSGGPEVIFDISTMPRELVFVLLLAMEHVKAKGRWVYHSPLRYNQEWQSRDPDRPRIVMKLGGELLLGAPTVLVLQSGYDIDRTRALLNFFEPRRVVLVVQQGAQFGNAAVREKVVDEFRTDGRVSTIEADAYSNDCGYSVLTEVLNGCCEENVVLTSLGPKPMALAMFRAHRKFAQTCIAYIPARQFNPGYSEGLGATFSQRLLF